MIGNVVGLVGTENIPNAALILLDPPFVRIEFSLMPDQITDSAKANWNIDDIITQTEPIRFWQHTSVRSISFPMQFYAYNNIDVDVLQKIDFLQSLQYPLADSGRLVRPPRLKLIVGTFLDLNCIADQVDVTWGKGAYTLPDLKPMVAEANLILHVANRNNFSSEANNATPSERTLWNDVFIGRHRQGR